VFIAGLQDKNEIRYSKILRKSEAPGFNEGLSIQVDPEGGDITQIASLDTNLIVYKRDGIYSISGNGPSDTGSGATFSEPEPIASDVGCTNPDSVVLGPEGLYFKSAKGIYVLSRNLSVSYIGSQVEEFNDNTITSAQLLDDQNEIRFNTAEGNTLVYNYYFKQWSVFPNQQTTDAVIWDNQHVVLRTGDLIHKNSPNTFLDDNSAVKMKIGTGWIALNGLQGYQRVYRMSLIGEYKTRHTLRVKVYNNYSEVATQTVTFVPADVLAVNSDYYGDSTYGTISPYGGNLEDDVYQFMVHIEQQKCQAIRFDIEDLVDNRTDFGNGESLNLSGVTVQVGIKRGSNKVKAAKKG
jgi:hypothetical protein